MIDPDTIVKRLRTKKQYDKQLCKEAADIIEMYQAMMEGVTIRVTDLEHENEALRQVRKYLETERQTLAEMLINAKK